jgi:tripartite-type tricarboxylate transporter receptor subunit TctC
MKSRLLAAFLAVAGLTLATTAAAQPAYPASPIRLVVPFPPGGSADVLGRTLAHQISPSIGQPIVIDNKPGAGTAIAARDIAGSAADGYSIMLGTVSSHAMNPLITANPGYDPLKDFAPVAPVASIAFALVVHPSVPAKSINEFLQLAKKQPGKLTFSSAGIGTSNHLAGELLKSMAGIDLLHVPYKGSAPALADLLAGRVDAMFDLLLTAIKHVQAGNARALAVTSAKRSPLLPEVPTFIEAGLAGYEVTAWFGIFAPAGTPRPVVQRLNAEFTKAVRAAETRKRFEGLGADPLESSPGEFAEFVRAEYKKWAGVIKTANIKPE